MSQVWTRLRAGTPSSIAAVAPRAPLRVVQPVPDRPQIHLIELPLEAGPEKTQVYLVEGDPLTLIDTGVGSAQSRVALESACDGLGYALADIERIVLTHAHSDHFGLTASIREAGGALECWVHEADADFVEDYPRIVRERVADVPSLLREFGVPPSLLPRLPTTETTRRALSEAEPTSVERRLREGDRVEWKDWGLRVLHGPGHTPGHILLEDEETGLLFTGDQVMGEAIPYAENHYLDAPPDPADPLRRRPRFKGLVEMRRTLRRLRGRRDKLLLPGFGGVLPRPDRAIRDTLLHYDVRLQRIERGLRSLARIGQDVTAYEIWKGLFPAGEPVEEMMSHLVLLIGALDCLEADGLIETERRSDGVFTHHHR